ncbi:sensor histidine kinase [Paenibacillus sp. FSL A5-0031]|uniref:sensor histidine kinase n=1 Tax=Paenibacillus sp. FSL A5-0031 TaxID=1920420 RepID=UPI00096D6479|nr:sensor histidine kinase [Paenibacillus sp. FSL A5-0031]OME84047.1 sensor histidine kinase [Paenibacillus sp. FSL A5-0031]
MKLSLSLNNVRLRNKLLILYIFSVFLPIVLTNVIFYNVTTDNVRNQRMKDITRAVEQINNEFRAEVEDAVTISAVFYTDYNLNEILETDYQEPAAYVEAYDTYFRRILNSYTPVYASIQSIKIFVENPTMLHSGGVGYLSNEIKQSDWYQLLKERNNSYPIFIRTQQEDLYLKSDGADKRNTFSIIREMNYFESKNKWQKYLKIDLKTSTIDQIFRNQNLQGNIYLIDDKGHVEYTTDPEVDWSGKPVSFDELVFPKDSIQFPSTNSYVSYLENWRIVGTISEEEVLKDVRQSREFVFVLACLNFFIPTLIILWISRSLHERLVRILQHMKKVKNQNFDTIKQGESLDEIGQLTSEFNRMTIQVKSLIDDVYIADIQTKTLELERRKAQLNALQSQINPHFLFNALETIRMRSLIKDEMETAKIIHNMAKIFRTSLTWGKDRVMVSEEIEFILCFLEIQKYRFEDRMNYDIHIDPAAKECMVPKMMFLPFVENASIHGIEPLRHGGSIQVQVEREADTLIFSIRDNGIGMDEQKVKQFYGYLESDEELGERIGVQNVIYRLKLIYGDRFQLLIESEPGQGTFIRVAVPVEI